MCSSDLVEARAVIAEATRRFPKVAFESNLALADYLWSTGKPDSASALLASLAPQEGSDPVRRATFEITRGQVAFARGRLREGERLDSVASAAFGETGALATPVVHALDRAFRAAWFRNDRADAGRILDAALAAHPLASIPAADRPYGSLVTTLAFMGRTDAAKATLADFDRTRHEAAGAFDVLLRASMEGAIAFGEKRYDAAASALIASDKIGCTTCTLPWIARAWDLGGHPDSALAAYERYAKTQELGRLNADASFLGPAYDRLGELYEARGDREHAAEYYRKFVELWKGADPELQPRVAEARLHLEKLTPVEKTKP